MSSVLAFVHIYVQINTNTSLFVMSYGTESWILQNVMEKPLINW